MWYSACGGPHGAYSGVAESGLCVIGVTELRRTAIAPWGAFNVSEVGLVFWCYKYADGLKVVAGLGLCRVTHFFFLPEARHAVPPNQQLLRLPSSHSILYAMVGYTTLSSIAIDGSWVACAHRQ